MRRPEGCTPRAALATRWRGPDGDGCGLTHVTALLERAIPGSVLAVAHQIAAADLLSEYQELTIRLSAEPSILDVGDLATLCAVAIARVQILERDARGASEN